MYPVIFHVGRLDIYTHGLMIALGAIIGGFLIYYLSRRERFERRFLFDLLVFSLFGGLVGARLTYVIAYYYQFANWHEMFYIWHGGLVSFGGILSGFLVAYLYLRQKKQNVLAWFDIGIIGFFLGWALGRVGCLLSGDVPGVASSAKIAIWGQIPVSLFEAIWSLILAAGLFYFYTRRQTLIEKWGNGILFFGGLAAYGIGRLAIDVWREEATIFYLKGGQIASVVLIIAMIVIIFLRFYKRRKEANYARENF